MLIAESALKWSDTAGPEAHRQSLEILVRMETLVSRLLELARAEHGRVAVNRTGIDLTTALHDTWRAYAAGTAAKRLDVTFDGPAAAEIVSDAALRRVAAGALPLAGAATWCFCGCDMVSRRIATGSSASFV